MPTICYVPKEFSAAHQAIIDHANEIIADYRRQGFDLTLRQLYYQFVARDLLPNRQTEYKRLGEIIADARLAGLVDWTAIVDRTRHLRSESHWSGPIDIIEASASCYAIDKWQDQPFRVEVWIEKDALVGILDSVCPEMDVPYFSCRGYTSLTEVWEAGRRIKRYIRHGQTPLILHLGDHDPSGCDMTRDIRERLALFLGQEVEVRRLALNWDQIEEYAPPPNPAKLADSRAAAYIAEFGNDSWELDALDPAVLAELVRTAVLSVRNEKRWRAKARRQELERTQLREAAGRWGDVVEWLSDGRD